MTIPIGAKVDPYRPTRLQIVSSLGIVPPSGQQLGGGGTNYTRGESRLIMQPCSVAASDIQLAFCNYYANAASGETDNVNAISVESALEFNGVTVKLHFQGTSTKSLDVGAPFALTDPRGFDITPGLIFAVRVGITVPSTQVWQTSHTTFGAYNGTGFVTSTNVASQIGSTGVLTNGVSGVAASFGLGPIAILGFPSSPLVSVAIFGDSITAGFQDPGDGFGNNGYCTRGLSSVNGVQVPWSNLSAGGNTFNAESDPINGPRKKVIANYATHAIVALGTNDINLASPLATIQTNALSVYAALKARGAKVYACTVLPRTTSTDSWATAKNQTPVSGFAPGGVRDLFNAWLVAQVRAGKIDGVIDVAALVEDPAPINHGKWLTNGTASYITPDGVHMNATGSALAAQIVTATAANWTPPQ